MSQTLVRSDKQNSTFSDLQHPVNCQHQYLSNSTDPSEPPAQLLHSYEHSNTQTSQWQNLSIILDFAAMADLNGKQR